MLLTIFMKLMMLYPCFQVSSSPQDKATDLTIPLPFSCLRASANRNTLSERRAASVLRFWAARAVKEIQGNLRLSRPNS